MSEYESSSEKPREYGLKAVRDARVERGRLKHGRISSKAMLVALGSMVAVALAAWFFREHSLSDQKEELLSKQRAVVTTVGAEWSALRDTLEKTTLDAAGPYKGDYLDPEASSWDFRGLPGVYLRTRVEDAKDLDALRKSAKDSARDSFVGCLLRPNNPSAAAIARGEDAGAEWQDQPWNLRLGYFATRILTDEWVTGVKDAEDELHLRVFVQQYEKAKSEEIPLTIDIVKKAQFFLLVLDEDVPEAQALTSDAGPNAGKVTGLELQQLPHPTRIHLIDLRRGKEMVRLRREAEADFRFAGERALRDPAILAAMKRQVNNCALARDVWATIKSPAEASDAGVSDAAK